MFFMSLEGFIQMHNLFYFYFNHIYGAKSVLYVSNHDMQST